MKKISLVIVISSFIILNPFSVILSEAKDLPMEDTLVSDLGLKTYEFTLPATIGFKAHAPFHSFKGETAAIKGKFEIDLTNLERPGRGAIEVEAKMLKTKNIQRDADMRDHLLTKKYPLIRYVITRARLETNDPAQKKADYVMDGELEIRGKKRMVRVIATLDYSDPETLKIVGDLPLLMSDYGVPIPSFGPFLNVKDKVNVYFQLTAQPAEK